MNAAQTKGPPEEIAASDLWLALEAIARAHRTIPFPRNLPGTAVPIGELAVWPLSQDEHHQSNAAADRFVKDLLKDPQKKEEANIGYQNLFANELAVQQLWRACRDPKDVERPAFPSPKMLRMKLSTDEVGVLYNHFLTAQAELGPIVTTMDDAEYEAWVKKLAEGGKSFPFDLLSWDLRTTLVRTMASQLVGYWTGTSSAGSPLDDSTSPTSSSETDTPKETATISSEPSSSDSAIATESAPTPDPDTGE